MDAILGSFTHKPRERRYFGSIYIVLRILHLLAFAVLNFTTYFTAAAYVIILAIVLVSTLRPHRNKWHNIIDTFLFSAVLHCYLMATFCQEASLSDPFTSRVQIPASRMSIYIVAAIIPLYGTVAMLAIILPRKFVQKLARLASWKKQSIQLDETLPYRIEQDQRAPLL